MHLGRARDAALRGRAHDALPDPGDAAHRADLRGGRASRTSSTPTTRSFPTARNFKATMLIEYADVDERQRDARAPDAASRTGSGCRSRARRASTRSPTRTSSARTTRRPPRCISCASSSTRHGQGAEGRRGAGDRRRPSRLPRRSSIRFGDDCAGALRADLTTTGRDRGRVLLSRPG